MKLKLVMSFVSLVYSALQPMAEAKVYSLQIQKTNSTIQFSAPRSSTFFVKGSFRDISGEVNLDSRNLENSTLSAFIPIATLSTDVKKRDDDLKGEKYFDSQRCSQATFKSINIRKLGAGKYLMKGLLTLHNVQKAVSISFGNPRLEFKSGSVSKFSARGFSEIVPNDFSLELKNIHPDGLVRLSGKVKLELNLCATRNP